ncbi:MAG: thiamine phosphate synthase [Deltaproteobacteria bacterium]|nr:thiamine phosphate synthase [Deltaproteobacteria bacterium]
MNPYRLCLVTDDNHDLETLTRVVSLAVKGGVTMVQLREKHGDVRAFIERAAAVKEVLRGEHVPLIINDRVDVALAVDADGVHLGQSDMPAPVARHLLGNEKLLGLSIEDAEQLHEANSLPVDYIGLSAIFSTPTKTDTKKAWGIDGLHWALRNTSLPVVAIGGINESNLDAVIATGVHGIAVVSAICRAEKPEEVARQLKTALMVSG